MLGAFNSAWDCIRFGGALYSFWRCSTLCSSMRGLWCGFSGGDLSSPNKGGEMINNVCNCVIIGSSYVGGRSRDGNVC